jgi:hypothetical protein
LALGLFTRDAVALLHAADELVLLAFDPIQVVVGEFTPTFLRLTL